MITTTRFAPSPTGPLHLGHAYSALIAHDFARRDGGRFLLRIEDIDQSRARPEWERQIHEDLSWLGLSWPMPVMRQSERLKVYRDVVQKLWRDGFLFACDCNRRDILEAASAPQEGGTPRAGPDGIIYPGTCREKGLARSERALRLDMRRVVDHLSASPLHFLEHGRRVEISPEDLIEDVGDVVIARRDMGTSYHLSVVIDDDAQGITTVTRGEDLFSATKIHVALQRLLCLPSPDYRHHGLIRDDAGKRLAKRDDSRAIRRYRDDGASPEDIRRMVGL